MEEYLRSLITGLEEKKECLEALIAKTAEQADVVREENVDWDAFDRLVDEKDELIDRLDALDDGFQQVFERIKPELEGKKSLYSEYVKKLQLLIREVTGLGTTLMSDEQNNKGLITERFADAKKRISTNKTSSRAAASYYTNMNQINLIDPQLMDKKK
ncbi:MAG: flagellar export chaperone FlgN [Lachnospiraceae bacterium]|nr:flagellar export chaperone FlgN [Lachnospiraceae bacterium]